MVKIVYTDFKKAVEYHFQDLDKSLKSMYPDGRIIAKDNTLEGL